MLRRVLKRAILNREVAWDLAPGARAGRHMPLLKLNRSFLRIHLIRQI
jgi:hypothetical protein